MSFAEIDPATPILVGVGQTTLHWDGASSDDAPSPQGLQTEAALAALGDSAAADALVSAIDAAFVIRANLDSVAGTGHPFGRLMRTRDFKEGVTAFAEKRKPEWSGT